MLFWINIFIFFIDKIERDRLGIKQLKSID